MANENISASKFILLLEKGDFDKAVKELSKVGHFTSSDIIDLRNLMLSKPSNGVAFRLVLQRTPGRPAKLGHFDKLKAYERGKKISLRAKATETKYSDPVQRAIEHFAKKWIAPATQKSAHKDEPRHYSRSTLRRDYEYYLRVRNQMSANKSHLMSLGPIVPKKKPEK